MLAVCRVAVDGGACDERRQPAHEQAQCQVVGAGVGRAEGLADGDGQGNAKPQHRRQHGHDAVLARGAQVLGECGAAAAEKLATAAADRLCVLMVAAGAARAVAVPAFIRVGGCATQEKRKE